MKNRAWGSDASRSLQPKLSASRLSKYEFFSKNWLRIIVFCISLGSFIKLMFYSWIPFFVWISTRNVGETVSIVLGIVAIAVSVWMYNESGKNISSLTLQLEQIIGRLELVLNNIKNLDSTVNSINQGIAQNYNANNNLGVFPKNSSLENK